MMQTFFSPQVYPIAMTLVVIALAFVLVSIMRRVVILALWQLAPAWIDRMTLLLQAVVLVGELAFIISFIVPGVVVVSLASLLIVLTAIALFPGNPVSDSVAFLRIRGLRYYRVGDWVTVAGNQSGYVVAIRPFSTLLQTPTQVQVSLHNSLVVGAPVIVHTTQPAFSVSDTPQLVVATNPDLLQPQPLSGVEQELRAEAAALPKPVGTLPISNAAAVATVVNEIAAAEMVQQALPTAPPVAVRQSPLGRPAPLVKRPLLGKRTIQSLYR